MPVHSHVQKVQVENSKWTSSTQASVASGRWNKWQLLWRGSPDRDKSYGTLSVWPLDGHVQHMAICKPRQTPTTCGFLAVNTCTVEVLQFRLFLDNKMWIGGIVIFNFSPFPFSIQVLCCLQTIKSRWKILQNWNYKSLFGRVSMVQSEWSL